VVVLHRTHYCWARGLCRAVTGDRVVYYDEGHRLCYIGWATPGSCAPRCSVDKTGTCCWITESLRISIHCVPCIVLRFIYHNNTVLQHLINSNIIITLFFLIISRTHNSCTSFFLSLFPGMSIFSSNSW
jgi:hypothetical protein